MLPWVRLITLECEASLLRSRQDWGRAALWRGWTTCRTWVGFQSYRNLFQCREMGEEGKPRSQPRTRRKGLNQTRRLAAMSYLPFDRRIVPDHEESWVLDLYHWLLVRRVLHVFHPHVNDHHVVLDDLYDWMRVKWMAAKDNWYIPRITVETVMKYLAIWSPQVFLRLLPFQLSSNWKDKRN